MDDKFTNVVRRRRKPGEIPTMSIAIRNQCLECVAYNSREVELCTDPACWLYPLRFGCYPNHGESVGKQTDFVQEKE